MKSINAVTTLIAGFLLASSQAVWADWTLNAPQSVLYFLSTKQGKTTELNSFTKLAGGVQKSGQAQLTINLASVNTGIAIRDHRLIEYVFETAKFPQAVISVDLKALQMQPGLQNIKATLDLHGVKKPIDALVLVTETQKRLYVTTAAPILLNASAFGLDGGITKLLELANLQSIAPTIPVTFSLAFDPQ